MFQAYGSRDSRNAHWHVSMYMCHINEWDMAHTWLRHVKIWLSHNANEWVMSQIWMRHLICVSQESQIYTTHAHAWHDSSVCRNRRNKSNKCRNKSACHPPRRHVCTRARTRRSGVAGPRIHRHSVWPLCNRWRAEFAEFSAKFGCSDAQNRHRHSEAGGYRGHTWVSVARDLAWPGAQFWWVWAGVEFVYKCVNRQSKLTGNVGWRQKHCDMNSCMWVTWTHSCVTRLICTYSCDMNASICVWYDSSIRMMVSQTDVN